MTVKVLNAGLTAQFGPYHVLLRDDMADVMTPDGGTILVRQRDLADMRRLVEWLEAVWTPSDARQGALF